MLKGKGGMLLTRAWGRGMGTLFERAVKEELVFVSKQRYCLCSGVCLARESDAWIFLLGLGFGGIFPSSLDLFQAAVFGNFGWYYH